MMRGADGENARRKGGERLRRRRRGGGRDKATGEGDKGRNRKDPLKVSPNKCLDSDGGLERQQEGD